MNIPMPVPRYTRDDLVQCNPHGELGRVWGMDLSPGQDANVYVVDIVGSDESLCLHVSDLRPWGLRSKDSTGWLYYADPSNDGNLDGGWSFLDDGESYPTLCVDWAPIPRCPSSFGETIKCEREAGHSGSHFGKWRNQ